MRTKYTPTRVVSIATAAALSLGLSGALAPAFAAEGDATTTPTSNAKTKPVKISAKQYPKLDDVPGEGGTLTFTKVAGVDWKYGTNGTEAAVTFEGTEKTKTIKDVKTALKVTASNAANTKVGTTETQFKITASPTTWTYDAPSNEEGVINGADIKVNWQDLPGSKGDAVILPKIAGITWTVGDVAYDAKKFGKRDSLTVKLGGNKKVTASYNESQYNVLATGGEGKFIVDATVTAEADKAAADAAPKFNPAVEGVKSFDIAYTTEITADDTVNYVSSDLGKRATIGLNPLDSTKGFGKDGSKEAILIKATPGVTWKVGNGKPKAYKVDTLVAVDPDDIIVTKTTDEDGKMITTEEVAVVATPTKGYTIGKAAKPVSFKISVKDGDEQEEPTQVPANAIIVNDNFGTHRDTVELVPISGVTWYVAQPTVKKNADGTDTPTYKYKALKTPKKGNIIYKVKPVKAPKGATNVPDAEVRVRAIPNRGFTVGSNTLTESKETPAGSFKDESTSVFANLVFKASTQNTEGNQTSGADFVTLSPVDGMVSWTMNGPAADSLKAWKLTVKKTDIDNAGAKNVTIPGPTTAVPKVAKGYTTWVPTPATTPSGT